jgi:hypothetical protein
MDDAMHSSIQMTPWEFEDVVLYRSLSGAYAAKVWALERGQSFTNHGYSSCAFDIRDSMSFDKAPVLLVIKIPRGTPFLYIDGLREAYCRKNRQEIWAFQSEVVLDKSMTFKVLHKEKQPVQRVDVKGMTRKCGDPWQRKSKVHVMYVQVCP